MAIQTEYIVLAPAFRQDDDPTDIEVKLLDVKVTDGYEYTAIIKPVRVHDNFIHSRPYSWTTVRHVVSTTKRRTAKATLTARAEFDRLLKDHTSPVWELVRSVAKPFGGVKESVPDETAA